MTYRLVVRDRARADLNAALDYLDTQNPTLGPRFLRDYDRALDAIRDNPLQYQKVMDEIRRVPFADFAYALFYRVTDQTVVVVACFHRRRDQRPLRRRS